MHEHAYLAQCDVEEARHRPRETERSVMLILFALALGTFAIGTGEFGSNGILQLFPPTWRSFRGHLCRHRVRHRGSDRVTGLAIAAARLNRRTLLLGLVVLFVVGNLLSAWPPTSGCCRRPVHHRNRSGRVLRGRGRGRGLRLRSGPRRQGVRDGDGRPDHRHHLGLTAGHVHRQSAGWQALYLTVAAIGPVPVRLWSGYRAPPDWTAGPCQRAGRAAPAHGLGTCVAALGISSIFAVYTFIGPFVTRRRRCGRS